jgi:hypothetical protein
MKTKKLVKKWVEAFNNGDADTISEFYSEEAVNHQVAESPIVGKKAIKQMFFMLPPYSPKKFLWWVFGGSNFPPQSKQRSLNRKKYSFNTFSSWDVVG